MFPERAGQDGVDVKNVVIDPRCGATVLPPPVMPAVADGHLKQVLELQRLVVLFRELEAGPERLVPGIGA